MQYYLEKNLDARERELEREAEIEEKAPKVKAKSKMSKVRMLPRYLYVLFITAIWVNPILTRMAYVGWKGSSEEAKDAGIPASKGKIERNEER